MDRGQQIPDFRDPKTGGSMIRVACWLASEIGEGGVFLKNDLREAVPGVEQIDRRMRDLRKYGWVIDESRMGQDLKPNELRLVKIGTPVWDREARRQASREGISDRVRQEVFTRDGHACVRCGVAAGERFADKPQMTARLSAAHIYPGALGGRATADDLVTACQRCNESIRHHTDNYLSGEQVMVRIEALGREQRAKLLRRIQTGRRESDRLDDAWRNYLQLPGTQREEVEERLRKLLGE